MALLLASYAMKVRESYTVNTASICLYFSLLKIYCKDSVIAVIALHEISLADSEMFLQQDCLLDFSGIDIILISNYHFMLALPFITEVSFDLFYCLSYLLVHIWKRIYTTTSLFLLVGETNCLQGRNITYNVVITFSRYM